MIAATFVTGLFDAVLLLAPPTLFVFAALGALLPETGVVFCPAPSPTRTSESRPRGTGFALSLLLRPPSSAMQLIAVVATQEGRTPRPRSSRAMPVGPGDSPAASAASAMRGECPHAPRSPRGACRSHEWPRRLASTVQVKTHRITGS
jgi:hypothetical protein